MTDTFANGPSTPGDAALDAAPQTGDVTGTLAELERKLRELESELSSIGRRRELADATPPESIEASPPSAGGRLVDEALKPPAPVISAAPIAPPSPITPPAPPAHAAPAAPAPAPPASGPVSPGPPPPPAEAGQPMKFMRPPESVRARATREPADRDESHEESEPQGDRRHRSVPARARRSWQAWRSCDVSATASSALRGTWRPSTTRFWAG